jgi:hypothetical protein
MLLPSRVLVFTFAVTTATDLRLDKDLAADAFSAVEADRFTKLCNSTNESFKRSVRKGTSLRQFILKANIPV